MDRGSGCLKITLNLVPNKRHSDATEAAVVGACAGALSRRGREAREKKRHIKKVRLWGILRHTAPFLLVDIGACAPKV